MPSSTIRNTRLWHSVLSCATLTIGQGRVGERDNGDQGDSWLLAPLREWPIYFGVCPMRLPLMAIRADKKSQSVFSGRTRREERS